MKTITADEKKVSIEKLSDEPLIGSEADFADWPDDVGDSIWDWINEPSPVQPGTTLH